MDSAKLDEIYRQYRQQDAPLPSDVETFDGCLEYFRSEANFWQDKGLDEFGNHFGELRSRLESARRSDNENDIRNTLIEVFDRLRRESRFTLGSKLRMGAFLATLAQDDKDSALSAITYFNGTLPNKSPLNARAFDGAVAAALFEKPEFANIGLGGRVQEFEREIERARSLGQKMTDALEAAKLANQEFHGGARECVTALLTKASAGFENLKKNYGELLSLQEPAAYWKEMMRTYQRHCGWFALLAIGGVLGLVWYVSNLISVPPAGLTDTSSTYGYVKAALLVGAVISTIVYLINLFVRLSTSALRLSRDARERFQLTRVYLARVAQGKMDEEKDRNVILASLFCRADTGLLKDGAPTITSPTQMAFEKFIGK